MVCTMQETGKKTSSRQLYAGFLRTFSAAALKQAQEHSLNFGYEWAPTLFLCRPSHIPAYVITILQQ